VVHHGVTGAVVGPGHQAVDVLRRSLEDRLHPAVGQVAHPSAHAVLDRHAPAGDAEADTLDPAAFAQLKNDLAVVVSAEALFVLTDLCGLQPDDAIASATRTAEER